MKENIIVFSGLYGENVISPMLEFIHIEPLVSRSKMYNWEIKEHLHTELIQVFVITKGEGILFSESKKINFNENTIIWIPPNTLHGFVFKENIEGEVFTFSSSILENNFKPNAAITLELSHLKCVSVPQQVNDLSKIRFFISLIENEIRGEQAEKRFFINATFQLLFLAIYRQCISDQIANPEADHRALLYFRKFMRSVKTSFSETKSIQQYAQEIDITTVHLNRICKTIIGKSPIKIIHEHLIFEAKKYLQNTNYTISEISYLLNFNDPAYFTRLFKKHVGVSPKTFRKA